MTLMHFNYMYKALYIALLYVQVHVAVWFQTGRSMPQIFIELI